MRWPVTIIFSLTLSVLAEQSPLNLVVTEGVWKGAGVNDVKAILSSTGRDLWKFSSDQKLKPIIVTNGADGPIVFYQRGPNGEYRVRLDTGQQFWSQYAYQFAHELCHIMCHYTEGDKSNHWFEESLCECASIFTLREMSKTWEKQPPFSNWKDYRKSLARYALDRIEEHRLPEGQSLDAWYKTHSAYLRENATDRAKNSTVATELLKIFEEKPSRWGAVAYLNEGRTDKPVSFATYLTNWRTHCPDEYKETVDCIRGLFVE
ncbi:MAG: hypothetical protein ACI9TH_002614 [Kiritimatiellia bacterium]|jgi:hypothetical protein